MVKRPDGKTIAVLAALLFFAVSAAVSMGVVFHGILILNGEEARPKPTTTTVRTTTAGAKKTTGAKKPAAAGEKTTVKVDGSHVIYLTFDDGPGPYTEKLLGIRSTRRASRKRCGRATRSVSTPSPMSTGRSTGPRPPTGPTSTG